MAPHAHTLVPAAVPRRRRQRARPLSLAAGSSNPASSHDLGALGRLLHATVAGALDATVFSLALYDAASATVEVVWEVAHGVELPTSAFPLADDLISQTVASAQPQLLRHWPTEAEGGPPASSGPASAMAVPLRVSEQVVGAVAVESDQPDAYAEPHLRQLERFADDAAAVIAGLHASERLGGQMPRRVNELEAILATMTNALLIVDSHGRLTRLNPVARQLLDLDNASVVLGLPFTKQQWGQWPAGGRAVAEAIEPVLRQVQRTATIVEGEAEIAGPPRRTLRVRGTPLPDVSGSGSGSGAVLVFTDVTRRREVERIKNDVFSIASHDLKTPATVIKAQAQLLRRRLRAQRNADAEMEEGLTMITDQADRLTRLLNLLLDLSRIESGRMQLDRASTDLRGILFSIARAMQAASPEHTIEVDAPQGVIGQWDAHRLEEVVQNLIGNAVKYSPGGGTVLVRLTTDGQQAQVTVTDQGIGLLPEELPRVFERFYRGHELRRLEGAGLGLYICQAIVDAHSGRIWAESPGRDQGSTFGFSLPLRPPDPLQQ